MSWREEEEEEEQEEEAPAAAWTTSLLDTPEQAAEAGWARFQREGLLVWPECAALSGEMAKALTAPAPEEARLRAAFEACSKSRENALSQSEFKRFFKGLLRSLQDQLSKQRVAAASPGAAATLGA